MTHFIVHSPICGRALCSFDPKGVHFCITSSPNTDNLAKANDVPPLLLPHFSVGMEPSWSTLRSLGLLVVAVVVGSSG